MADSNRMVKMDMSKISDIDKYFIEKFEKLNKYRAAEKRLLRRKNMWTGLALLGGVFAIYILL